jgi:hypothetical protein
MNDIVKKKFYRVEKDAPDGTKEVWFIASTPANDRYDDVVDQSWRLENYRSNPVVQADHDYSVKETVGRGMVKIEDGLLMLGIEKWSRKAAAQDLKADVDDGIINAVSVGFRPGRSVARASLDKDHPYFSEQFGYVHYDNELLEVSIVAIPANPEALAQRSALPSLDLAALERQLSERVTALVLARVAASLPDPTPAPAPAPADPWFD